MKAILNFLLSLKTAFGLFVIGVAIFLVGSLMLPNNLAFFSGIDDSPLFAWLSEAGEIGLTWWIFALIGTMAIMGISTALCTAEALLKGVRWDNLMLKLSPQVMHIGVLLIMLGHLLTAWHGQRWDLLLQEGGSGIIEADTSVLLQDVRTRKDEAGYETRWEAELYFLMDGKKVDQKVLRPARPVYFGDTGFYIRSVKSGDDPSALIRVCRDPGALWALIGGVLVSIGGLGFMQAKFKKP